MFPVRWKTVAVSTIHKSGATDIPDNFHPTALLLITIQAAQKNYTFLTYLILDQK